MHQASFAGHLDVVKLLLSYRAKTDILAEANCTPLFYAAAGRHFNIIKLLVANGADVRLAMGSMQGITNSLSPPQPTVRNV